MPAVIVCFCPGIPVTGGDSPGRRFSGKMASGRGAMRADAGVFAWLGPVVLMVSALLTAGYLFPVIVAGFFPGMDWRKTDQSEDGRRLYLHLWGVPLAVLGISLVLGPGNLFLNY